MSALLAVLLCAAPPAAGAAPRPPRPLRSDRPQATRTPFTVDRGRVQLELGFFEYTRDRGHSGGKETRLRVFDLMAFELKLGVGADLDLELGVQPLLFERTETFDPTTSVEREGFGDTYLRAKWSLWGNDGGRSAFGLLPFVKLPTAQDEIHGGNDAVEGGLLLPYALDLGGGWDLGLHAEFAALRDSADARYVAGFGQSGFVRRTFPGGVAGYLEIGSAITSESGAPWAGTVGLGLTYALTQNAVLDLGGSIGISDAAPDSAIFAGVTLRF